MKKLLMMIGAAAVAVGAYADTVTTNGVTWTYTVLDSSKSPATVQLGGGTSATTCIAKSTAVNAADIPWTFTNDGIDYTVTAIGAYAFSGCSKLSGTLAIPASVTSMGNRAFENSGISAVSSIGGITTIPNYAFNESSSLTDFTADISKVTKIVYGAFQSCNLNHFYVPGPTTVETERLFRNNKSFKLFFAGPNTTGSKLDKTTRILSEVSDAKVFVPVKTSWSNLVVGGSNNEVIWYGATTNLNLVVDDAAKTITATPTDETALVKVLESAPLFKTHFGWNTRVNITNTIEATAGTITAEMLNAVEFNTLLLTFKVNTQAALDSVLAAVPASNWPLLAIDASDSKEELTLPQGREIYVRVSGDGKQGKYIPKIVGLTITFY